MKLRLNNFYRPSSKLALVILGFIAFVGCTAEQKNEFKAMGKNQQFILAEESASTSLRETDILFVIDNSGSMQPAQDRLKASFTQFAQDYFKPEYNICVSVITSDLYRQESPTAPQKLCTKNSDGSQVDLASLSQSFMTLAQVGDQGHGSERPFHSLRNFIHNVEKNASITNKFFRKGSFRVVAIITDENDQSVANSAGVPQLNASYLTTCPTLQFGDYQYTLDYCIDENATSLYPVANMYSVLDDFFNTDLDDKLNNKLGFMVVGITLAQQESLMRLRKTGNYAVPTMANWQTLADSFRFYDRAKRVEDLVGLAGNGSFVGDITSANYSGILAMIGSQIEKKLSIFSQFSLNFAPRTDESLVVTVTRKATGSVEKLNSSQFRVDGNILAITDMALVATFKNGDALDVYYVPASLAR